MGALVVTAVVILLLVTVSMHSYKLYEKQLAYEEKITELRASIEAEIARSAEIDTYAEYVKTREYKETVAKERLGLVYPDEILLKPE